MVTTDVAGAPTDSVTPLFKHCQNSGTSKARSNSDAFNSFSARRTDLLWVMYVCRYLTLSKSPSFCLILPRIVLTWNNSFDSNRILSTRKAGACLVQIHKSIDQWWQQGLVHGQCRCQKIGTFCRRGPLSHFGTHQQLLRSIQVVRAGSEVGVARKDSALQWICVAIDATIKGTSKTSRMLLFFLIQLRPRVGGGVVLTGD